VVPEKTALQAVSQLVVSMIGDVPAILVCENWTTLEAANVGQWGSKSIMKGTVLKSDS
jgi:hypothetical protein